MRIRLHCTLGELLGCTHFCAATCRLSLFSFTAVQTNSTVCPYFMLNNHISSSRSRTENLICFYKQILSLRRGAGTSFLVWSTSGRRSRRSHRWLATSRSKGTGERRRMSLSHLMFSIALCYCLTKGVLLL